MQKAKNDTKAKKKDSEKENCYADALNALISAFDCADTFWKGNGKFPHYSGPLFTKDNYIVVQELWDEVCDTDFSNIKI